MFNLTKKNAFEEKLKIILVILYLLRSVGIGAGKVSVILWFC